MGVGLAIDRFFSFDSIHCGMHIKHHMCARECFNAMLPKTMRESMGGGVVVVMDAMQGM